MAARNLHRLRWRGAVHRCRDWRGGRGGFLQGEREVVVVWVFFLPIHKVSMLLFESYFTIGVETYGNFHAM